MRLAQGLMARRLAFLKWEPWVWPEGYWARRVSSLACFEPAASFEPGQGKVNSPPSSRVPWRPDSAR
jgi:hypothetical protein